MKSAILILAALLCGPVLWAQENTFRLTVLGYQWTTTHKTLTFSWPGHANTSCNGSGDMSGYISSGGNISASETTSNTCSTTYTPPTNENIDIQKPVVFILAETDDSRMVLTCTRNVRWSQCHALSPGVFLARNDNGHFEVEAHFGKDKKEWVKFDVVQQTAISRQQAQTPPGPQVPAAVGANIVPAPCGQAQLQIASTPDGADIEIDGNFVGNTPSTVGLSPGQHGISVKKPGFKPWERKVTVSSGQVNVNAVLEPESK